MDDETLRHLEEMDATLRELEMDGRLLEERIRSGQSAVFTDVDGTATRVVGSFSRIRQVAPTHQERTTHVRTHPIIFSYYCGRPEHVNSG